MDALIVCNIRIYKIIEENEDILQATLQGTTTIFFFFLIFWDTLQGTTWCVLVCKFKGLIVY